MKTKKNIMTVVGLILWLATVLFACWLPSVKPSGNDPFLWAAIMGLVYFAALTVAVFLCSVSLSMVTSTGRFAWQFFGRNVTIILCMAGLAWLAGPYLLRVVLRGFIMAHLPITGIVQLHILPLGRICEASFGLPLAMVVIEIAGRRSQPKVRLVSSEAAPSASPDEPST